MQDDKKPKFHKLIDGYETSLNVEGTHEILGKTYHFGSITAKQCDELIAKGSQYLRLKAEPIKKKARGEDAELAPTD